MLNAHQVQLNLSIIFSQTKDNENNKENINKPRWDSQPTAETSSQKHLTTNSKGCWRNLSKFLSENKNKERPASSNLWNKTESYTQRRDTHKAKMLEKNGLIHIKSKIEITKEITPIKASLLENTYTSVKNANTCVNKNQNVTSSFTKRKYSNTRNDKEYKFIKPKENLSKWTERPSSVGAKFLSKTNNSYSNSSISRVINLKEKRNNQKQHKIGVLGNDYTALLSNPKIINANKIGWVANSSLKVDKKWSDISINSQLYKINQNKFKMTDDRIRPQKSYLNLYYQNNKSRERQNNLNAFQGCSSQLISIGESMPTGEKHNSNNKLTMQFKKRVLNQEFEQLEEEKQWMNINSSDLNDSKISLQISSQEDIKQENDDEKWFEKFVPSLLIKGSDFK